jgi:hypothetical protein
MRDQVLEAQWRVAKLVLRHKDAWAKDLSRHLSDSGALYRAAIVALEQARGALAELVQVGGWLQLQRLGWRERSPPPFRKRSGSGAASFRTPAGEGGRRRRGPPLRPDRRTAPFHARSLGR